jgi:nitroreductase
MTVDEALTTTHSVRKRLDFSRPVGREVIEECLTIAQQAPTPSNLQNWQFVVVTDAAKRQALADIYRKGFEIYETLPIAAHNLPFDDPQRKATQARSMSSARYLATHMQEAPVLVVPCIAPRADKEGMVLQSALWGTISQASWSFMLAARARGLGTVWTCLHLFFEEEAATVLGIPYSEVMQAGIIPVAYTRGTRFKPAPREPLSNMVHWEGW